MGTLRTEIIGDLIKIEQDLGTPTFTWNGNTYNLIPSISEFTRELDTGGYKYEKMLTATVRKYNTSLVTLFSGSVYPTAQQKIVYNDGNTGTAFRIESIKHDPTNSYMRMICTSAVKGL